VRRLETGNALGDGEHEGGGRELAGRQHNRADTAR
jgi:hypothetical protein